VTVKSTIERSAKLLLFLVMALAFETRCLAGAEAAAPASNSIPLKVLILSGAGSHDWRATDSFLRQLMLDSGRFDVRVTEVPSGITAPSLVAFDLVIDDYNGPRLGIAAEKALEEFVKSGKGLLVTREALGSFAGKRVWPEFIAMTKVSWPANATELGDAPFRLFELKTLHPEHPVIRGLKDKLRTGDQPRHEFALQAKAEILATTDNNEPILFASNYGKGRVFCTALGHDLGTMQEKAFITTFLRGAEWAASGKVTLPNEIGLPEPGTNGLRVLVVNGGHDHEASFYSLFDGYNDIGWVPVTDSKLAFQEDIRTKYDVLIFYDFTRDLDEKGRKNLRDFVESGKGIVVLHHGILSQQKWPWWYEDVVGGLYRLERKGGIPNSTVKYGEEHLITPAGSHPITAGVGPFHVTDETYKGLYISPNVKPLLYTDNPTSDRTVAWIGPCTTSRVVFIQLGHGHTEFRHPSYRALVHNSILWTGGRLN
jgi:type 1 glutamine amidotransferase